jgi:glycosyltransferase involved in cell wall biosynthesis
MEPRISVVMAVYNGDRFLKKAIESILNQSMQDFEFLIINDNSADQSEQIIESYTDKRIRVFKNSQNVGAAEARNIGLRNSKGFYVALMDCDDIAHPDRLKTQMDFLDSHPDIFLVSTACEIIDEADSKISTFFPILEPAIFQWKMLIDNQIYHSSVMYRNDIAKELGGYDKSKVPSEDYDLWCKIMFRYPIAQIGDVLTYYRVNSQGLTSKYPRHMEEMAIQIIQENIWKLTRKDVPGILISALRDYSEKYGAHNSEMFQLYFLLLSAYHKRWKFSARDSKLLFQEVMNEILSYIDNGASKWHAVLTSLRCGFEISRMDLFSINYLKFLYRGLIPVHLRMKFLDLRKQIF